MKKEIFLRKGKLSDLDQIRQLFFEAVTKLALHDYTQAEVSVWASGAQDKERWEKKIEAQHFIVAILDNKIIGFTSLLRENYIDHLFVSPNHKGIGVASILIDNVEELAKKSGATILKSDVSITARPFFEKRGYVVVKRNEIQHKGEVLINFDVIKQV